MRTTTPAASTNTACGACPWIWLTSEKASTYTAFSSAASARVSVTVPAAASHAPAVPNTASAVGNSPAVGDGNESASTPVECVAPSSPEMAMSVPAASVPERLRVT